MSHTINSKTTLKQIKRWFRQDFGIVINNEHAKEIRKAVRYGTAVWRGPVPTMAYEDGYDAYDSQDDGYYINAAHNCAIQKITPKGVQSGGWYTRDEWNAEQAS